MGDGRVQDAEEQTQWLLDQFLLLMLFLRLVLLVLKRRQRKKKKKKRKKKSSAFGSLYSTKENRAVHATKPERVAQAVVDLLRLALVGNIVEPLELCRVVVLVTTNIL